MTGVEVESPTAGTVTAISEDSVTIDNGVLNFKICRVCNADRYVTLNQTIKYGQVIAIQPEGKLAQIQRTSSKV